MVGEIDLRPPAPQGGVDDRPEHHAHQTAFNNGQRLGHVIYSVTLLLPVTVVVGSVRVLLEIAQASAYTVAALFVTFAMDVYKTALWAWQFDTGPSWPKFGVEAEPEIKAVIDAERARAGGEERAEGEAALPYYQNKVSYRFGQLLGHLALMAGPMFIIVGAVWTVNAGIFAWEHAIRPFFETLFDNIYHHFSYFVNLQLLLLSPEHAKTPAGRGPRGFLNFFLWVVSGAIGLSASLVFLPLLAVGTALIESWVWLNVLVSKAFKLFSGAGPEDNVAGEGAQEEDIIGLNDVLSKGVAKNHLAALFASSSIRGEAPEGEVQDRSSAAWFVRSVILGSPGLLLGGIVYGLSWAAVFTKEKIIGQFAHIKDAFLIVSAELTKNLLSPSMAKYFKAADKAIAAPPYNIASAIGTLGAMLVVGLGVSLVNALRCAWHGKSIRGGEEGDTRPWLGRNSGLIVVGAGLVTPAYLFFGGLAFLTGPLGLGLLAGVALLFLLPSSKDQTSGRRKTLNKFVILASSVGIGVVFFIALSTVLFFPPATAIGLAALATVLSLATHVGLENFGDFFKPIVSFFNAVVGKAKAAREEFGAGGITVKSGAGHDLDADLARDAGPDYAAGAGGFGRRGGEQHDYLPDPRQEAGGDEPGSGVRPGSDQK